MTCDLMTDKYATVIHLSCKIYTLFPMSIGFIFMRPVKSV